LTDLCIDIEREFQAPDCSCGTVAEASEAMVILSNAICKRKPKV